MSKKRILIIDQDEMVLSLLKRSLLGHEPNCEVYTANDQPQATAFLGKQGFDVVISDFILLTDDQYLLFDFIRNSQKYPPSLAVTGYPNTDLSLSREGLTISHTLLKPIEISTLNTFVQKIFDADQPRSRQATLNLTEEIFRSSDKIIIGLLRETNARCILVCDTEGRIILKQGTVEGVDIDAVTALLGGGIATLLEAGKSLDDHAIINLTYREGQQADLYAINIGVQLLLVLVIDKGPLYNRLGTVWYFARQAAIQLSDLMGKSQAQVPIRLFDEQTREAYVNELDRLFKELAF